MTKSIAVCALFRRDQLAGGVYSFCENLLRGMAQFRDSPSCADPIDLTVFHSADSMPWQDEHAHFRPVSNRLSRFAASTYVGAFDSQEFDGLLFPNYFTPPVVRARRTVTVIHDLQFRHLPAFHSPLKRSWLRRCHLWSLAKCDAVVAISEVVRQDMLVEYGQRFESTIKTIHNPVSLNRFDTDIEQTWTRGRPYIMCVAMDRPAKNLFTLVRAFDRIKDRFPDHQLVMAGQLRRHRPDRREKMPHIANEMPSTEDLVKQLNLQDRVVVTGFVSDAELGALYRGASLFVLPSLFEGFGMPAVESLALGTPTIVSDLPVLREVTLGRAQYIENPRCHIELSELIGTILQNVDAARPSAELMGELRRHYAPQRIAEQYCELLTGESCDGNTSSGLD